MCQAQDGQGAGAPPRTHLVLLGLPLGPQSFRVSGAHPEEADAPRAPPDPGHKLASAPLEKRAYKQAECPSGALQHE